MDVKIKIFSNHFSLHLILSCKIYYSVILHPIQVDKVLSLQNICQEIDDLMLDDLKNLLRIFTHTHYKQLINFEYYDPFFYFFQRFHDLSSPPISMNHFSNHLLVISNSLLLLFSTFSIILVRLFGILSCNCLVFLHFNAFMEIS